MIKKILPYIVAVLCLFSCKTKSLKLKTVNQTLCSDVVVRYGYEDICFIKNKEFRKISRFLRKKYNVTYIRNIFYIKSKEQYYCEFNINDYTINCLFMDKNFKVISSDEYSFDI